MNISSISWNGIVFTSSTDDIIQIRSHQIEVLLIGLKIDQLSDSAGSLLQFPTASILILPCTTSQWSTHVALWGLAYSAIRNKITVYLGHSVRYKALRVLRVKFWLSIYKHTFNCNYLNFFFWEYYGSNSG